MTLTVSHLCCHFKVRSGRQAVASRAARGRAHATLGAVDSCGRRKRARASGRSYASAYCTVHGMPCAARGMRRAPLPAAASSSNLPGPARFTVKPGKNWGERFSVVKRTVARRWPGWRTGRVRADLKPESAARQARDKRALKATCVHVRPGDQFATGSREQVRSRDCMFCQTWGAPS